MNTPLHYAAAQGNVASITALLAAGANLEAQNVYGHTPLITTFEAPLYSSVDEKARLENITALLAAGANVNASDKQGRTILDLAIAAAALKKPAADVHSILQLLIKHKAQPGDKQVIQPADSKSSKSDEADPFANPFE